MSLLDKDDLRRLGNLVTGDVVYEEVNHRLIQGWEDAIAVTLEAIYRYENEGYEHIV